MSGADAVRAALAERAVAVGAFQVRPDDPVRWASGYRMPVYTDNRLLLRDPVGRRLVTEALATEVAPTVAAGALIAGTATAGIAPAALVADRLGAAFIYVRSEAKGHGLGRRIEGLTPAEAQRPHPLAGSTVVLIEDLLSTGGSSAAAARTLMDAGATVPRCVAIVTYGFPRVAETFEALPQRCVATALLTGRDLIDAAVAAGALSAAGEAAMRDWLDDPFGWQERHP